MWRLTVPSEEARRDENRFERLVEGNREMRWRSEAQRDHDRLLYSSAFQRLGGVTQVTAPELGRPFHTRLTHTLKVAQVARRSAERLKARREKGDFAGAPAELVDCLDVDATESAALAHDIGHPPFGHLAEKVLNAKATAAGGFEGNPQSFRVVTRLALRSAKPGIDLTRQTLNGMLKYPWLRNEEDSQRREKWGAYPSDEDMFKEVRKYSKEGERSLEACVMDWADDVTYAVHDLDDFARAGLIPLDQLAKDEGERRRFKKRLEEESDLGTDDPSPDELIEALEEALRHIDLEGNYEERPEQRVAMRSFGSMLITQYIEAVDLRETDDPEVGEFVVEGSARNQVEALKQLTWMYVVRRPSLAVIQKGQGGLVERLWQWYFEATGPDGDERLLPPAYRARLADDDSNVGRVRLATDLVAGLTERSAFELYRRMSGMTSGSVLDVAAHTS